jgi:site-specific DNA-cytosine methylase
LIPCFLGGVELSGPLKARDYKDIDTDGMNYNSSKLVPVATPMLFENHPQDSRVTGPHDVAPSCVSQYGTGGGNVPLVIPIMPQAMQVRRLTPTECERLQGFPDGWTAIPWKKKPADQCPDGPRYKALGNSMAVNCMEWLGERIQAVESGTL